MIDLSVLLNVVTPTTIAGAAVAGLIVGLIFLPVFGDSIGADRTRRGWGAFVAFEVVGISFLLMMLTSRYLDGSSAWLAWLGVMLLWSLMCLTAAVAAAWARR